MDLRRNTLSTWLWRETEFESITARLLDKPASGFSAWSRTTSGAIVLLLSIQFVTGLLLGFHYVPAAGSAYTTVSYIELVVREGAFVRSLHYHSSVLLPVIFVLHLIQMIRRGAFSSTRPAWFLGIISLGLVLAAAATGYALPWDARAINGVNIAASLAGNTPLLGETLRAWLIGGTAISTLTLSRFYALHVWIVPGLIMMAVAGRIFIFGKAKDLGNGQEMMTWAREQFRRNALVAGILFVALSVFSLVYPAPFGPQIADAATYLPRPGPQFLWLFEMQKYTDGAMAAILAFGFPTVVLGGLLGLTMWAKVPVPRLRALLSVTLLTGVAIVTILTGVAVYQDNSEARISDQLARQEIDEIRFRSSAFEPQAAMVKPGSVAPQVADSSSEIVTAEHSIKMPSVYTVQCAKCHGANGEGTAKFPEIVGLTTREEDQLSPELILDIINDPKTVGRSTKMPAYKNKLSETEKQDLVSWIKSLKPLTEGDERETVQTAKVEDKKEKN
ncbi:MAG: cytochrome b N-terminal domain-containing protein [Pyrinomonadaceae bacterium]